MGVYIYAITAKDHSVRTEGLHSVGPADYGLRVLVGTGLKAVVSDAPENLRPKRRELLAHQAVLERLMEAGTVLPMRFGLVAPDEQSVISVLDENVDGYRRGLLGIEGCVEYNVKVSRDEEDLLREILADSEDIRRFNQRTLEFPASHRDKVALGELIAGEVTRHHEAEARRLAAELGVSAKRCRAGGSTTEYFATLSFLVARGKASDFTRSVQEEAKKLEASHRFTLSGPLPPYSFV